MLAQLCNNGGCHLYGICIRPHRRNHGSRPADFLFSRFLSLDCFFGLLSCYGCQLVYLMTGNVRWDTWAYASAEIGTVFCTLVLITGPLWAKPVWNTWWTWDMRLTTTLILWLMYLGYLMLRSTIEGERGAKYAAVFGIIAFLDVPFVYFSNPLVAHAPSGAGHCRQSRIRISARNVDNITRVPIYLYVSLCVFTPISRGPRRNEMRFRPDSSNPS